MDDGFVVETGTKKWKNEGWWRFSLHIGHFCLPIWLTTERTLWPPIRLMVFSPANVNKNIKHHLFNAYIPLVPASCKAAVRLSMDWITLIPYSKRGMNIKNCAQELTINICVSLVGLRDRNYFVLDYTKIEYIHKRISEKKCLPEDNALLRKANRNKDIE